jgi:uncharacterized membrane protein
MPARTKNRRRNIMAKTVIGLFDSVDDARRVVQELLDYGFESDDISIVTRENGQYVTERGDEGTNAVALGAGAGATVGGLGGLMVGLAALAIPGIGPVIAAGPLATTLAGAGLGATVGGIIGALTDLGIPEEAAHYYAEGVRRGGALVSIETEDDMSDEAAKIMARYGAVDIDERVEGWRKSGWTHFDPNTGPYQATDPRPFIDPNTGPYRSSEERLAGERQTVPPTDYRDYDVYDADFRSHYTTSLSSHGYSYERCAPAYRYGYDLASDRRHAGSDWTTIEPEAKRRWEERHQGTWEEFKDTVRYAWDKVRGRR